MYDVIIIGGGPAGLSAATTLGRSRRPTVLCDAGGGRNRTVRRSHGFLTQDGLPPHDLRRLAREQLARYDAVTIQDQPVISVRQRDNSFEVHLADGDSAYARRMLIATGIVDVLPPVPGLAEIWGRSAFNCPYCDGFETRERRVVVLGASDHSLRLALQLSRLAGALTLCTGAASPHDPALLPLLRTRGVTVREEPVERLTSEDGMVKDVVFSDGSMLACEMVFLRPSTRQGSDIPRSLGCGLFEDGSVQVNDYQQTTVAGVFAAGDLARRAALPNAPPQIVHAAAAGALAAVAMDRELLAEEVQRAHDAAAPSH